MVTGGAPGSGTPVGNAIRSPRFAVPARVCLSGNGGEKLAEGRLIDISCHGALARIPRLFAEGTPVTLRFELLVGNQVQRFSIPGSVSRLSRHGTAIEFGNVSQEIEDLLMRFSVRRLFGRD
ncbi:MAG: PilZ domain-containing protein [Leptospirillia bacterium]